MFENEYPAYPGTTDPAVLKLIAEATEAVARQMRDTVEENTYHVLRDLIRGRPSGNAQNA